MGTVIIMQYLILLSLAACALSAPQQVPYVHQEIPAEPYVHVEIPAEPYVHQEIPAEPYYGESGGYAGQPTGYAGPAWTGGCVNNLDRGFLAGSKDWERKTVQSLEIDWPVRAES